VKGDTLINTLQDKGYLQTYSVLDVKAAVAEAAAAPASSSSSSSSAPAAAPAAAAPAAASASASSAEGGGARPVERRTGTQEGQSTAQREGKFLDEASLTRYRTSGLEVLQGIYHAITGGPFVPPRGSEFPPSSSETISSFAGSIISIRDETRPYYRASAMTLIVHILDEMGYVGFPALTPGVKDSLIDFFGSRAISFAVGTICMATPHIVMSLLGLPAPSLAAIWAFLISDGGLFAAGSAITTAYLNRDKLYGFIKSVYSGVFGEVDPTKPSQVAARAEAARARARARAEARRARDRGASAAEVARASIADDTRTGKKPPGSRKTRKASSNKKHSKTRKSRKSRGNGTHRVRKRAKRSSGKKSRRR